MVTISETAARKAKEILVAEGKAGWGLRIYTAGSSCCGSSYGMDIDENPGAGDEVVEKDGLKVFIDKNTLKNLSDMQIDFIEEGEKQGFVLTGGKAPSCESGCSSCG
ncbi:MAG: iron-sulfur cluster assembly accessory protein [Nitrospirae bacterium]|nr:iron-sulfur cluster assembly accessory protein [Nitrospirota bacterium]